MMAPRNSILSGRLRSAVIIGGQGIRARKLRTFLSMISLFMGVLAVVTVQAGAEIAQRAMLSDVELQQGKDGTRVMYVPDTGASIIEDAMRGRTDAVASLGMNAIIGEPGVRPVNEGGMSFENAGRGPRGGDMWCDERGCYPMEQKGPEKPAGQAIEVRMQALTGDVRSFRPFRPVTGQWLDFGSAPSLAPRIVLNREAAKGFRMYQVPAEMSVQGATAHMTPQIVGVIDDGGYEPTAYIRIDELRSWLPSGTAQAADPYRGGGGLQLMMSPGTDDLEQTLKAKLAGTGLKAEQLQSNVINSRARMLEELAIMRWIFLGMAALVLLIGVAGILNVGLATVGERVEEFALRRAVGTSRMLLAGIVLSETLLTGLLTAGAAIGVGVVGLKVGSQIIGGKYPSLQGIEFPWQAGVAGVIAGLVAGILGGLIPAVRAARIPIATVMRA